MSAHVGDATIHVTAVEKGQWSGTTTRLGRFLAGVDDNTNLLSLLSGKADKSALENYVTLDTEQEISGAKKFTDKLIACGNWSDDNGLYLYEGKTTTIYGAYVLYGKNDMLHIGTWNGSEDGVDAMEIKRGSADVTFKGAIRLGDITLSYDAERKGIRVSGGLYTDTFLSAYGFNGTSGGATGGLNESELAEYLTRYNYITVSALSGYATQTWVNQQGFLKSVAWGDVTGKPSWIGSTKPSYAFSEIASKPTTLAGYGITDAKIANGVITLGGSTITPLTSLPSHTHSYLPLTGGTLKNGTDNGPLNIDSDNASEVGMRFKRSGVNKGWTGYNDTHGTNLYNYATGKYLGVRDDGHAYYDGKILLHSGNISSYAITSHQSLANYVTLDGVQTITGNKRFTSRILRNGVGQMWIHGRNGALIVMDTLSGYSPLWSIKTNNGSWDVGAYDNPSFTDRLIFTFITDSNYSAGANNPTIHILFRRDGIESPAFFKSGGTATQALMADGSVRTVNLLTSVTNLGWIGTSGQLATINTLAFWNGQYASGSSNLQYCDRGRFGTMATATATDYLARSGGSMTNTNVVTNLNADLLDGVHYANILERDGSMSFLQKASDAIAHWYRVGVSLNLNSVTQQSIVFISRTYWSPQNEGYVFSISIGYNGNINISQLSGVQGQPLIDKIRIAWANNAVAYLDIHVNYSGNTSYTNTIKVTSVGAIRTYASSEVVIDPSTSGLNLYEYSTHAGIGSNVGFHGNAVSATVASYLKAINDESTDLNSLASTNFAHYYGGGGCSNANRPTGVAQYGLLNLRSADGHRTHLLVSNNIWYSRFYNGSAWSSWSRLAYLTDNVASATRLQGSYSLWGQTFYGNNVSGDMTSVGNITLNVQKYLRAPDGNGTIRTLIDFYAGQKPTFAWGFATAGTDVEYCGNNIYLSYGTNHTKGLTLNTSGYVGIGTETPSYKLHVNGDTYVNGWMRTAGNAGWFSQTYGGGWYMSDYNFIRAYYSKPVLVEVGSANSWGIGGHRLNAVFAGTGHASILLAVQGGSVAYGICANTDGKMYFGKRTNGSYTSMDGDKYLMNLSESGLSIGNSTTIAAHMLDVGGTVKVTGNAGNYCEGIRIHPYNNWSTIVLGGTDLGATGTSANSWSLHAMGGNFYVNRNGSSTQTSYLLCNVGGNWGFGNNDPKYKIDALGNMRLASSVSGSGGDVSLELWRGVNASWRILNSGGNLYFQSNFTSAVTSYFNCLTIAYNTGDVGIAGDLSVGTTLHKSGYAFFRKHILVSRANMFFANTNDGSGEGLYFAPEATKDNKKYMGLMLHNNCAWKADAFRFFFDGTLWTKSGMWSDSYVSARGQNTSSDARLKRNFNAFELALHEIAGAPSVTFDWMRDGKKDVGSIAQYWQGINPMLTPEGPDGFLTLQYGKTALLASISIAKRVKSHEERIRRLEKENEELRAELKLLRCNK